MLSSATVYVGALQAGSLSGQVVFEGKPRPSRPVSMSGDAYCKSCYTSPVMDERFVYGKGAGDRYPLANIFVYVKSGLPAGPHVAPAAAVTVTRKGCTMKPHVVGIRVGQELRFQNDDKVDLELHVLARKSDAFSARVAPGAQSPAYVFRAPEVMAKVKCDAHSWESVFVGVVDHPFFAVTGPDGRFDIKGLPDGDYRVESWQELLGKRSQTVSIKNGDSDTQIVYKRGR